MAVPDWDAPAGSWMIYRFGHTTMGALIQPAQPQAIGLECDKMSEEAVSFHLDHILGDIKKHLGDLIGTGFTHLYFDSYEAGLPNWTPKMKEEFLKRRGYDLTPYPRPLQAARSIARMIRSGSGMILRRPSKICTAMSILPPSPKNSRAPT